MNTRHLRWMAVLLVFCTTASAAPEANLKILTWNIQMLPTLLSPFSGSLQKMQAVRAPWIVDFLKKQDYDLLCLQEVFDPVILAQIEEGLKPVYPYCVRPPQDPERLHNSGVMFLSRFPIREVGHVTYRYIAGIDQASSKGGLMIEGEKDGVRFQVAGTHLQAGHQAEKDKQYEELAEGLMLRYREEGVPQFLVGDMNTSRGSEKCRLLLELTGMQEGPIDDPRPYTTDPQNSWKRGGTPKFIDHVFINPCGTRTELLKQTIQRPRQEYKGKMIDLADHYGVVGHILLRP